jgi:hypothetical protein
MPVAYSIAFAFSNQPVPVQLSIEPIDFTSYCDFAGSELNINPVVFTAIGSQSDNVGPPVPPGSQLSFFWG